jgi:hypothetical protein
VAALVRDAVCSCFGAAVGRALYRAYADGVDVHLEFICVAQHIEGVVVTRWSKGESAMDDKGEPPSSSRAKVLFRVGKNSRGNWVVQDQSGLCGGMFVNRTEAVKFAMFENGYRPQAVIMVPGTLELDMSRKPGASTSGAHVRVPRAA